MATISLDNMVMYQYPKPKNPSRLLAIPHGTSSFSSHVTPSVTRPSPSPPCASPVQPTVPVPTVPIPLGEEYRSFIPYIDLTTSQIHSQSGDFHQPTGVASVDSDANKEHDMCNIAIDQDDYQIKKKHCNNYVDERSDTAEFSNAKETSNFGVSAPARPPEVDTSSHCSDEVQHGSTVPESPIWEIPPDVPNEFGVAIEPSGMNFVDQESTSVAVTMPISEACIGNSTITALEDTDSRSIVHQASPTNEITETDFVAPQPQRTDSSQTPAFKRKDRLQLRNCTAVQTTPKAFSVIVPHRNLRSSNTPRTRLRSRRSPSAESTASDDSNDSDYQGSDHTVNQITNDVQKARPAKRRKRDTTTTDSFSRRQEMPLGRAYSTASLPSQSSPEPMAQNMSGLEKIRIGGCLLRKVSLGRIEYCCWFAEDNGTTACSSSVSDCLAIFQKQADKHDQLTNMTDLQVIKIEGFFTREHNPCGDIWCCSFKEKHTAPQSEKSYHQEQPPSCTDSVMEENKALNMHMSAKGDPYSREEDELIVQLKEVEKLPWSRIAERFPGRTKSTLQVRYCTALKDKRQKSHLKWRKRRIDLPKIAAEKPQQRVESPSSGGRYSLRQSRHLPDRYIAK
uniref:Myb-related protein Hv1 n=1 Tax=Talaromyces marneffei PM1 TaxID=1077442 RepID=A0A093VQ17_TALMA